MRITIIGAGYVGLVTGVGFALNGHNVVSIDRDANKVKQINQGIPPFYEYSFKGLLSSCVGERRTLRATEDLSEVSRSDVTFICVGTYSELDGKTNLDNIVDVAGKIGCELRKMDSYHSVTIKSTISPGTTEEIIIPTLENYSGKKVDKEFGVAVNPEFLQEGNAMECFQNPDRIVIGEHDRKVGDILEHLYRDLPFSCPIIRTNPSVAEMIKYASNAFLATKISFINQIGNLCKNMGIDVYQVAKGIGYDPRIGDQFLEAGIGFGGSCLPKDLTELIHKSEQMGLDAQLLKSVLATNTDQSLRLVEIAEKRLGDLKDKTITVLGLAFKPNTDDIRDAPSLRIISQLLERGALVKVYDPEAMPRAKKILPGDVDFCPTLADAIHDSECIVIATEWNEFKDESLYKGKLVIDGRRVFDPETAGQLCRYEGICW
ncbi:UDP-glucose dehydrogenase family protein [Chloroflexota bacterium]